MIDLHLEALEVFKDWLQEVKPNKPLISFTKEDLKDFARWLRRQDYDEDTTDGIIFVAREFLNFVKASRGITGTN